MDLAFFKSQFTALPAPTADFSGQTIIVTGSNIGLGLEAARHFAALNAAKVILAVRSIAKGEEAARSIHESTGRNGVCEVWQLDMSNFNSIKEFVKRCDTLDRLDVAELNAGIATSVFEWNEVEQLESTVAVNVVGTFLLALNLLPILRAKGTKAGLPKLVITSSEVHAWCKMEERNEPSIFEALKKNDKKYMAERYPVSKLLEVLFVRALAERMDSGPHAKEVVLNCLNPGLCHSGLTRNMSGVIGIVMTIMKLLIARTTEMGSRTLVAAAVAGPESMGQYMSDCKVTPPSPFVRSEDGKKTQERVYSELIEILEKLQPGISKNI